MKEPKHATSGRARKEFADIQTTDHSIAAVLCGVFDIIASFDRAKEVVRSFDSSE
jgi:hypothetical protein